MTTPEPAYLNAVRTLYEQELNGQRAPLWLGPYTAFELVSALQLALRHPAIPEGLRERLMPIAHTIIDGWFQADARELLQLVFEPDHDVPFEPAAPTEPAEPAEAAAPLSVTPTPAGEVDWPKLWRHHDGSIALLSREGTQYHMWNPAGDWLGQGIPLHRITHPNTTWKKLTIRAEPATTPAGQESFTCPRCQHTSHNPNDVAHQYCGNCHEFMQAPR